MCPQVEKLLADAVALMEEGDAPSGLMFNCMYGHYKIAFEVRPPPLAVPTDSAGPPQGRLPYPTSEKTTFGFSSCV